MRRFDLVAWGLVTVLLGTASAWAKEYAGLHPGHDNRRPQLHRRPRRPFDHRPRHPQRPARPFAVLPAHGDDATHLSTIDARGSAVALTDTLVEDLGSKAMVASAGFRLNNKMGDFSASRRWSMRRDRRGHPGHESKDFVNLKVDMFHLPSDAARPGSSDTIEENSRSCGSKLRWYRKCFRKRVRSASCE